MTLPTNKVVSDTGHTTDHNVIATQVNTNAAAIAALQSAASVGVKDEGTTVVATVANLNFTGAGVTASDGGSGTATVAIPGSAWEAAGPAYTNPRGATQIRMSAYDAGTSDQSNDFESAYAAAVALLPTAGKVQILLDSRRRYTLATAPRTGSAGQNAQVRLAQPASTGSVELVGIPGASPTIGPQGTYPVPQGTVIASSATPPSFSAGNGLASMFGGPASYKTSAAQAANSIVYGFRDITFEQPDTPKIACIDAGRLPALILRGEVICTTPEWTQGGTPAAPTNLPVNCQGQAIIFPAMGAWEASQVDSLYVLGYPLGINVGEWMYADRMSIFGCLCAVAVDSCNHPNMIGQLTDTSCLFGILGWKCDGVTNPASFPQKNVSRVLTGMVLVGQPTLKIGHWSSERGASPFTRSQDVYDPNGDLVLEVPFFDRVDSGVGQVVGGLIITGNGSGANPTVRVVDALRGAGPQTAPGVPASTTALRNPFARQALVQVTGGTVTVISVNGTATGQTSGSVLVPPNGVIAITYSVAPTWTWQTA